MVTQSQVLYIDVDSGTVLNGPVYMVEVPEDYMEELLSNDESARRYARDYGVRLTGPAMA